MNKCHSWIFYPRKGHFHCAPTVDGFCIVSS